MNLIEIKEVRAEFVRVSKALERIAEALERAFPPPVSPSAPATEEDFNTISNARLWELEQEEGAKQQG